MGTTAAPAKPSRRNKEMHSSEIKIEQLPQVTEVGDEENEQIHLSQIVIDRALHAGATKEMLAELSFNEEPVTVMFTPSQERFAAPFVDASVNGDGIEVLTDDGKWLMFWQVPVGVEVTMKRKYLEIFARCKHTDVKAFSRGIPQDGSQPINELIRTTNLKFPFMMIEDKNPRGKEWLTKILTARV